MDDWKPSQILDVPVVGLLSDRPLVRSDRADRVIETFRHVKSVKIPLIIMQTWKTNELPKHWKPSQDAIRKHLPHWKYVLMTDDDNLEFVKRFFPDFLHIFQAFEHPIQRADAIRYMWLYVNGGVYLDLDLEIIKPLDDLFYEDKDLYVVRSVNFSSSYTNAFMAAKPRLKVMLQCLEDMREPNSFWHVGKHLQVVKSTGPDMFTHAIFKTKALSTERVVELRSRGEFVRREDRFEVSELPSHLIVACDICQPKPCCAEGGYCRLLGGSSWGSDINFTTVLFCNRYYLATLLLIVLVMIITIVVIYYRNRARRRKAAPKE
jgi:inositol phosphorylceramide mannosyltransferase catalytic subunit